MKIKLFMKDVNYAKKIPKQNEKCRIILTNFHRESKRPTKTNILVATLDAPQKKH